MLSSEEKADIADDAEKSCTHPIVMSVVEEFAQNMGLELKFPFSYGLSKIANAAASVAIAYERGIDPNDLLLNSEEQYELLLKQTRIVGDEGAAAIGVILGDKLEEYSDKDPTENSQ